MMIKSNLIAEKSGLVYDIHPRFMIFINMRTLMILKDI